MQKLTDLSDARLASITNHKHNTILKALRDTDLSVAEIAKKLRVTKSSVYHVIEKYLPRDFLRSRASSRNNALFPAIDAKDGDKDDDLVIIVPPKKNSCPSEDQSNHSLNEDTNLDESSDLLPTTKQPISIYKSNSTAKSFLSRSESEEDKHDIRSPCSLTIESRDFKLQWIGATPQEADAICMVLNTLQKKIGE